MKDYINTHINANMQKGFQTYVGALYFYEDGLEYKAKAVNSNIAFGKILYSNIMSVINTNTLGIVPNGIKLLTYDGEEYKFVVSNRQNVIKFISSMIKQDW